MPLNSSIGSLGSSVSNRRVLEWSDVCVERSKGSYSIRNVTGSLGLGRLTGIIGPSGCGKTLLLELLAGRVEMKSGRVDIVDYSENRINLQNSSDLRNYIGYVSSKDELMDMVTVCEALEFNQMLRPRTRTHPSQTTSLSEYYMNLLDLENFKHTQYSQLISVNHKRLATIASEMISERKILLLDTPLNGLTQLGGYQFIKTLKKLVATDSTNILSGILCSLVQPTSEVLSLFDDIILMADYGQVIYQGPVCDMGKYFLKFGHNCPTHYNIADFALFVLHSISAIERDRIACELQRTGTCESLADGAVPPPKTIYDTPPLQTQIRLLFMRQAHEILRNWKQTILPRIIFTIVASTIIGLVYYQIGTKVNVNSSSYYLQAYRGCIMVICCNAMFSNAQSVVLELPFQKKVFLRENSLGMYSPWAYLASKLPIDYTLNLILIIIQLLIEYFLCSLSGNFAVYLFVLFAVSICTEAMALSIACTFTSPITAIQMLPLAIFPQIIFSGLIISIAAMPNWISWIQYVCFLPYGLKILTINEFGCADVAQFTSNDVDCTYIALNAVMLVSISAFFRLGALIALQFKPKTYTH